MAEDEEDIEEEEMEEWEREASPPRRIEDMVEDITRIPPHKSTEVLSPAALAERRNK